MVTNKDIEKREDRGQDYRAPLIPQDERRKENNSVVYLNTFDGSITAGGSYDNLIGMFGTKGVAAIGVSLGIESVFTIMEQNQKDDKQLINAYRERGTSIEDLAEIS
uniref:Histidine--tRNA ligase, cytoplasmic n=1 Tax=Tanacetum cinerariifolium TaxID=118510 RepID=A0A6L2MWF0_TANCI|nr:histidine--tRNA ligase, cytoplasmic [Tanacetum cinerariifolium]